MLSPHGTARLHIATSAPLLKVLSKTTSVSMTEPSLRNPFESVTSNHVPRTAQDHQAQSWDEDVNSQKRREVAFGSCVKG
jgi:hypothetical protein